MQHLKEEKARMTSALKPDIINISAVEALEFRIGKRKIDSKHLSTLLKIRTITLLLLVRQMFFYINGVFLNKL